MSETKPAMTASEWAVLAKRVEIPNKDPRYVSARLSVTWGWPWSGLNVGAANSSAGIDRDHTELLHAAAALCLHGQPFGFTREDVEDCRDAGDAATRGDRVLPDDLWGRMNRLADRLEALLPPATPTHSPTNPAEASGPTGGASE